MSLGLISFTVSIEWKWISYSHWFLYSTRPIWYFLPCLFIVGFRLSFKSCQTVFWCQGARKACTIIICEGIRRSRRVSIARNWSSVHVDRQTIRRVALAAHSPEIMGGKQSTCIFQKIRQNKIEEGFLEKITLQYIFENTFRKIVQVNCTGKIEAT